MSALEPADERRCALYVQGLLGSAERAEFDRRLAQEPELARRVADHVASGALLASLAGADERTHARARRVRPLLWALSIALGLAVLAAIALHLVSGR